MAGSGRILVPPGFLGADNVSTDVPGLRCIGKHHVFDHDVEVCRCGAYRALGARGLVPVSKAGG